MNVTEQRKIVRVLFDEFHSESWSISKERAQQIAPDNPGHSSYQIAADLLTSRDFCIQRNLNQSLEQSLLASSDVVVLAHPTDSKWEATTSPQSPKLSDQEIKAIQNFVREGGGLIVITEYEHDKYGDNLNELLQPFGMEIENTTVTDPVACLHENPTWIFAQSANDEWEEPLTHRINTLCFYRAASCKIKNPAKAVWSTSDHAKPSCAPVIAVANFGKGRVVLITDSSLFGDNHIQKFDHAQLWLNLFYWCSTTAFQKDQLTVSPAEVPQVPRAPARGAPLSQPAQSEAWLRLKSLTNQLRKLQNSDGSIPTVHHAEAQQQVKSMVFQIRHLQLFFDHQSEYINQLLLDLNSWVESGFQKPNFEKSLLAFHPERNRCDQIENLVVFPLYTPNASKDIHFEALITRMPWPKWLEKLEQTTYRNEKFAPGHLVDFTDGYASECAVLFPETISSLGPTMNHFSTIFCNREAKRLQTYAKKAAQIVHFPLHPQLECFLGSLALIQETLALWDLIHDKSHSLGALPFDPFMIRQKAPFWMYALEELRVDLRSYGEALRLTKEGFPFATYVTYAILLDRIFRFPITGPRVRNYDALGGQLLFSFLHQKDVLLWSENRLKIRWELLDNAVRILREEIATLYKHGADCSKVSFWIEAHDLISRYVHPNVASRWKKEYPALPEETNTKQWIHLVHEDEFPLGNFHTHLLAQMNLS